MSIEDQDEELEEEEEFHEVEEEKHKTSQELVSGDKLTTLNRIQNKKDCNAHDQNEPQIAAKISSLSPTTTTVTTNTPAIAETSTKSVNEDTKPSDRVEPPQNEVKQFTSEPVTAANVVDATVTTTIDSSTESSVSPVTAATNTNADVATDSKAEDTPTSAEVNSQSESARNVDWANIMLTSNRSGDSAATGDDNNTNDDRSSRGISPEVANDITIELEDIIARTEKKLMINDESIEVDSLIVEPTDSKLDLSSLDDQTGTICEDADPADDVKSQEVAPVEEKVSEDAKDNKAKEITNEEEKIEKTDEVDVEAKELDLDEDVKNPQYIPKKGVFYEHDDRSHDVNDNKQTTSSDKKEEETVEVKQSSTNKKTAIQERPNDGRRNNRRQRTEADRWNHDLFRDEKQKPKSKTELISAYGYDIRQERSGNQGDARPQLGNNNTGSDKNQPVQENQRTRQNKEGGRRARQEPTGNRSREARPRRQNTRNNTNTSSNNRTENFQGPMSKRDGFNCNRVGRSEIRDVRETNDDKHKSQASSSSKQDREYPREFRNTRNNSRGRRRNSRDRPNSNVADERPPNAMMAPITIWSSEDMAKAEAFKEGPPKVSQQQNITNNNQRNKSTDLWQQAQPANKNMYQSDKPSKNSENENRQPYNSRGRYQDRVDDPHKANQYAVRNQYGDRSNQHDWHRTNNYSPYIKSNDYIVKTQTFENSRLSQQANINRSNNRDLREVLNERRMHGHQNYQSKGQLTDQHHLHQRGQIQNQLHHQPYSQPQHQPMSHHQNMMNPNHPPSQHLQHHPQQPQQHQPQQQTQHQPPPPPSQAQSQTNQQPNQQVTPIQQSQPTSQHQAHNHRQPPTSQAQYAHPNQSRQNVPVSGISDTSRGDSNRLTSNVPTTVSDLLNNRPIIKTETYTTAGVGPHQQQQPSQPVPHHSQNHRTMGGPLGAQQGPNPSGSLMVPSHLGAGANQTQYYSPSNTSRDQTAAAAALANAYHGYIPGGHPVMDTSRYHMTSQQLSDHGYMPSAGQTNVASASVLHQQGMYSDATTAGGTVASSAYMAQTGSTLSPSNIPVTGAGPPPLPPVSYLQQSQYPPPPYSNPYSQPHHNQAPPQSSHGYPPYWSYHMTG